MWQRNKNPTIISATFIALVIFIILVVLAIQLLTQQPWLGLKFQPAPQATGLLVKAVHHPDLHHHLQTGDVVLSIRTDALSSTPLDPLSLVDDPDNFPTLSQYNTVHQRNAAIFQRLSAPLVTLTTGTGKEIEVAPLATRPLTSLPANFWINNFTALVGLLFAVAIGAYPQQSLCLRLLQAVGLLFAVASMASAVYASRDLALDPDWYRWLTAINHLAMPLVAYSLLMQVLIYPHRLVPIPIALSSLLLPVILWLNALFQWTDLPFHTFYSGMILAFLLGIPPSIRQWRLSNGKPVERAALKWILLSIYIASGAVVALYFVPTIFAKPPALPMWAAQLMFLPLYFGFILGVSRYRLFDVERWWIISWQWVLNGLLIISIDLLLVCLLHIQPISALSIAMILVAWLYFPVRQWVWFHIGHKPALHLENHIHGLIRILLDVNPKQDFKQRWLTLLQNIFKTSSAEIAGGSLAAPLIGEHGMNMLVPGVNGNYHIDLYGKDHSARLFSPQDMQLAKTLTELAMHTQTLQQATDQGAKLERNRIMRDLHDDVGANLLSMIYRAKDKRDATLAKETLLLLRETIYTLDDNVETGLTVAIAKWRQETQQRCMDANVQLNWQADDIPTQYKLTARQFVNLGRVLRETQSNALKHAHPSQFSVHFHLASEQLHIWVRHNGTISPPEEWIESKGIPGMRARTQELGGSIDWVLKETLETQIMLPLNREAKHENTA